MTTTDRWFVKSGVYFSAIQGEGIVMDLTADRYIGISDVSTRIWGLIERGLSTAAIIAELRATFADDAATVVSRQLELWAEAGLITASPSNAPPLPVPRGRRSPASDQIDRERLRRTRPSARAISSVTKAHLWSKRALAQRSFPEVLQRAQGMLETPISGPRREKILYRIVRAHELLRLPFKKGENDCLTASLSLVVALRRAGIDADFCLGVLKFPFFAHAWVEADELLLNERPLDFTLIARF